MWPSVLGEHDFSRGISAGSARASPLVSDFVLSFPVRAPFTVRPPASTHTMLSPSAEIWSRICCEPPSPIATVQITAPMPIVIPSIVSALRILFRPSTRNVIRARSANEVLYADLFGELKAQSSGGLDARHHQAVLQFYQSRLCLRRAR